MKTSPAGINYSGPTDGENNPQLQAALNILQNLIKTKLSTNKDPSITSKAKNLTILTNDTLNTTINDLKALVSKLSEKEETPKETKEPTNNIKNIQEIFNSNPFGITYEGPKDGNPNEELISKSRSLEQAISKLTGAKVNGKITDGKTIITSAIDLKKTFGLINEYKESLK